MPQFKQSLAATPIPKFHRIQCWHWFLVFWLVFNGVQAGFTELSSDEGYYWFYSRHLQWGYYDHPPIVALLIRAGIFLLPGEIGVRFFNLLFLTGALWFFFLLLPQKLRNSNIIFGLLLAAPLVNYLSFIVFPDGPLLFFTMAFLWLFRRFLHKQDIITTLLLGAATALMFYSKYHGVLVVFFSLLAVPQLFLNRWYWLAMITALLLFLPHLWWQYQNHFPTLQYHLTGRSGQFSIDLAFQFLSQQIGAISPALIFIPFVARVHDRFERSLLFIITGTFVFFFISSFKTFVHFHWTSIALFPILYFAAYYYGKGKHNILFRSLVIPFAILLLVVRFILLFNVGISNLGEDYYHGRIEWARAIKKLSGGDPVFFPNNLREAPLYSFYTGKTGVTLYDRPEKKSQYELWHYEDSLQGKNVLVVNKYEFEGSKKINSIGGEAVYYTKVKDFQTYYNDVPITVVQKTMAAGALYFTLQIKNDRQLPLRSDTAMMLIATVLRDKDVVKTFTESFRFPSLQPGQSVHAKMDVLLHDLPQGNFQLYFGFKKAGLPDSYNSAAVVVSR